jgi:hypothetical protein
VRAAVGDRVDDPPLAVDQLEHRLVDRPRGEQIPRGHGVVPEAAPEGPERRLAERVAMPAALRPDATDLAVRERAGAVLKLMRGEGS